MEYLILLTFSSISLSMNWRAHITSDHSILLGKPSIKGTRISIEHIVGLLAKGWTEQQILDNYPRLTYDSLKAIFAYIQDCMKDGLLHMNS
jgi:uncharacterized protein (DUF433 family)